MRILVTGTAGFIGYSLAERLLADGHEVFGVDGMTTYYDINLKRDRHARLKAHNGFSEHILRLEDSSGLIEAFAVARPEIIVHLAAQAGVRHSLEFPREYIDTNVVGTFNIIEMAKAWNVRHLLLASTSSVYGANESMPFRETDKADLPLTIYAATKKATELMSHSYSHLWGIQTTAFRFFTVYGPWGRPDMALFKFADAILKGRPIDVYNEGRMSRDFTYIDDLVEAIARLIDAPPVVGQSVGPMDSLSPVAPWRVVNIGGGAPVSLLEFIEAIETTLQRKAVRNYLPLQPGDVPDTTADASLLRELTGFVPNTPVLEGVRHFCEWFMGRYASA